MGGGSLTLGDCSITTRTRKGWPLSTRNLGGMLAHPLKMDANMAMIVFGHLALCVSKEPAICPHRYAYNLCTALRH